MLQVQHSDFAKIKEEAKEKGRRQALAELDAMAADLGYASLADALKRIGEIDKKLAAPLDPKPQPVPQETTMPKPTATPAKTNDPRATDKAARESARLAAERDQIRKDYKASKRKERELQRRLDASEAQRDLMVDMTKRGVTDLDYMMRLATRELAGKSEEEMAKFDWDGFYERHRKERPFLFGEKVIPATTGTNGTKPDGSQPAAPSAAKPIVDAAQGAQFDAKTATKEAFNERLRALGLNPTM